jgi:4,5-DOPA dioxygenase extradiol
MKYPVLFLSHGSPMLAVEDNDWTAAWRDVAASLPRPRAILMVSAHWESEIPLLTGASQPETIHDFGGFPDALYQQTYPAPGAPELARAIQDQLAGHGILAGVEGCRGLDHGAWVPLMKMFAQADIPVLQLSVQPALDAAHHRAVGAALQSLREEGVLIVASGHMTHNLRDGFRYLRGSTDMAYAAEFRAWVHERILAGRVDDLLSWQENAPAAARAHPSVEHFLPLFVALGAAGEAYQAQPLCEGYEWGVLAMDAYRFD